jgi:hypothetical protein
MDSWDFYRTAEPSVIESTHDSHSMACADPPLWNIDHFLLYQPFKQKR